MASTVHPTIRDQRSSIRVVLPIKKPFNRETINDKSQMVFVLFFFLHLPSCYLWLYFLLEIYYQIETKFQDFKFTLMYIHNSLHCDSKTNGCMRFYMYVKL